MGLISGGIESVEVSVDPYFRRKEHDLGSVGPGKGTKHAIDVV